MAWTEEETVKLIELWGEDNVQAQLESCTRHGSIYQSLATKMQAAGYSRNAVQCGDKIKKLRAEYKRTKDNNGLTGRGTRKWKYFDQLDAILGHRPATAPPVVLDTSAEQVVVPQNSQKDSSVEVLDDVQTPTIITSGDEHSEEEEEQAIVEKKETIVKTETIVESDKKMKSRKRKRPCKSEIIEKAMEGAMNKVAKAQEITDSRFLEIEEKKLKFDEMMLEMENRRWKEERDREERQRREEREFQLKV